VIFFPNKPVCCDGVWGCASIAIHILNIGGVRYMRNLKIVTSFSGEGFSGTHWLGGCVVASIPTNLYVSNISERQILIRHVFVIERCYLLRINFEIRIDIDSNECSFLILH
jgi:hypothetical protein